ncbi:MAG: hypothetical protein ACFUZC_13440 [Chthoniobacteraceae bacterium]
MKLSKEIVQKIFLGVLFAGCGVYYYTSELVGPLAVRETKALAEIKSLEGKIKDGKAKISQQRALEASDPYAEQAQKVLAAMKSGIPSAQPVAWLPTRLGAFFKGEGIPKQSYRPDTAAPNDPGLSGYQLSSWTVEIPSVSYGIFGKALAGFENQDGLCQVTALQINAVAKDPESHNAQITFSTFVKSEK